MRLHLGHFLRLSLRIRQQFVLLPEILEPRQWLVPREDADGYLVKDGSNDEVGSGFADLMCPDGHIAEKVLDWRDDVVLHSKAIVVHVVRLDELAVLAAATSLQSDTVTDVDERVV